MSAASFFSILALSPGSRFLSIKCYEPTAGLIEEMQKTEETLNFAPQAVFAVVQSPACDLRGVGTSCPALCHPRFTPGTAIAQGLWHIYSLQGI